MFWGIKIWHSHADEEVVDDEMKGRMLISNQSRKSNICSPYHFSRRCYHLGLKMVGSLLRCVQRVWLCPLPMRLGHFIDCGFIHQMKIVRTIAHHPRQLITIDSQRLCKTLTTWISETHDAQTRSAHIKVAQKAAAATRWKVARGVTTLFCMTRC